MGGKEEMNAPSTIKQDPAKGITVLLSSQKEQIKLALPRHMTPDRMLRICLTELRKSEALQRANPLSFLAAVIQCSQLGLEPGSGLGHAYLVPYGSEVQPIIGYRGMIELARRSGQIVSIGAFLVHERDQFELRFGLDPDIKHVPAWNVDPGPIVAAYAVAKLKDGGTQFEVMSRTQLDEVKAAATKGKRGSPWFDHFDEMARKTVIRRLFKYLPISVEMARAIEVEERNDESLEITNFETGEPITLEPPVSVPSTDEVETHKRLEALAAVWSEVIAGGGEPDKLIRMSEADIVKAPKAKQEQTILFLRDWLKSKGTKPNA